MKRPSLLLPIAALLLAGGGCGAPPSPPEGASALGMVPPTLEVREVLGDVLAPLQSTAERAQVFIFVRTDCPIANRYAPEISALSDEYAAREVPFWLVYVDPDESDGVISRHLEDYALTPRALRDDRHLLVEATGATVTPTAVVVRPDGRIAYRGRIDARYPGFGKARKQSGRRDLAEALEDLLAGRPVALPDTEAVGCFITDLTP